MRWSARWIRSRAHNTFKRCEMERYKFDVFADYFQFQLEDDGVEHSADLWKEQILKDRIITEQGVILIDAARNMTVPVNVEIYEPNEKVPYESLDRWDHVVECSIKITMGRLVVWGNDYYPDAPRINLKSNTYRVSVYFAGQYTLSPDGLDGDDSYLITLQPGPETPIRVIKQGKSPT